jgi:leucyl-tRNA synthetase
VEGSARFLQRVWRVFDDRVRLGEMEGGMSRPPEDYSPSDRALLRKAHQTIKRVTDDIARFHFNTAISGIMELVNAMTTYRDNHGVTPVFNEVAHILVLLLAPITPHITEELWHALGGTGSVHTQPWPRYDEALAAEDLITLVVQVNGKVRDRITLPAGVSEAAAKEAALTSEQVARFIDGKQPRQVVYVPGKLVNIVV